MDIILIVILVSLIIGIILFLLSGLFIVKDKKVAVLEKLYKFYKCAGKGVHFYTPFLVRRVGYYSTEIEYIKMQINEKKIFISYQIDDFEKYHYAGHCFKEIIFDEINKDLEHINDVITDTASRFGIKIIEIRVI